MGLFLPASNGQNNKPIHETELIPQKSSSKAMQQACAFSYTGTARPRSQASVREMPQGHLITVLNSELQDELILLPFNVRINTITSCYLTVNHDNKHIIWSHISFNSIILQIDTNSWKCHYKRNSQLLIFRFFFINNFIYSFLKFLEHPFNH